MSAQRRPNIRFHLQHRGKQVPPLPVELAFATANVLGEFRHVCAAYVGVRERDITSLLAVHHNGSKCVIEVAEDALGLVENSIVSVETKPLVRTPYGDGVVLARHPPRADARADAGSGSRDSDGGISGGTNGRRSVRRCRSGDKAKDAVHDISDGAGGMAEIELFWQLAGNQTARLFMPLAEADRLARGEALVGARILKRFAGHGTFAGTVKSYSSGRPPRGGGAVGDSVR